MDMTRSWARTSVGIPSRSAAPVVAQIKNIGFWMVTTYLFFALWFPAWGEVKFGGSPNVAPPRLMFFGCLGIQILLLWIKPYGERVTRPTEPMALWVWRITNFYFLWELLSVLFFRPSLSESFTVLKSSLIPPWMAFWFACTMLRSPRGAYTVVKVMAVAGVIQLVLACIEGFWFKRNIFAGLLQVTNLGAAFAQVEQMRDGIYRTKGSFSHALVLANYLVATACTIAVVGMFDRRRWVNWGSFMLAGILTGATVLTNSRSGMAVGALTFGSVVILRYWLWSKTMPGLKGTLMRAQLIWIFGLAAIGGVLVKDLLSGRSQEEIWSSYYRLEQYYRAVPAIIDEPLFGYGANKGGESIAVGAKNALGFAIDNQYILLSLDFGLVTAIAFFLVFALSLWRLMPRRHEWQITPEIGLRLGFVALFGTMLIFANVHALADLLEMQMILVAVSLGIPGRYSAKAMAKTPLQKA